LYNFYTQMQFFGLRLSLVFLKNENMYHITQYCSERKSNHKGDIAETKQTGGICSHLRAPKGMLTARMTSANSETGNG